MPPQRLVFEGPTPESVILDACSEHGASVRLTEPERFRRGGVMGFFARSGYRVRVMPESAAAHIAASAASLPQTAAKAPAGPGAEMASLLAAAPDVSVELGAGPAPTFDQALERAAGALGPDPSASTGEAFDRLVASLTAPPAPQPPPEPLGAELFEAQQPAAAAPTDDDPLAPYRQAALDGSAIPGPAPTGDTEERDSTPMTNTAFASAGASASLEQIPARPTSQTGPQTAEVAAKLRAVGFPNHVLAAAAGRLPAGFDMEQAFSALPEPRPIPRVAGALIAIIGDETAALAFARGLAGELEMSPDEVALARTTARAERSLTEGDALWSIESSIEATSPDLYVETSEQAIALAPGWRRDRIAVVAVAIAPNLGGAARARTMLRSLRPSITLLLADAAHKAADVALRAEALGGVDALVMHNLIATSTPAEMLATDIAVARLDQEAATPSTWARLVEETLDERAGGERRL